MLPLEALRTMKVLFATPAYASNCAVNYTTSMFKLAGVAARNGLDCDLMMHSESLVTSARNKIVAKFLDGSYTHLFWIDADIGHTPEAVMRLLLSDYDVVSQPYPLKEIIWPEGGIPYAGMTQKEFEDLYYRYPVNLGRGVNGVDADEHGFIEVANTTTGFMCIKRRVLTKMKEAYPELHYNLSPPRDPNELRPSEENNFLFFDCRVSPETNEYLSEDYAFCKLWREIGGKVMADTASKLSHLGQYLFEGDLTANIMARQSPEILAAAE